MIVRNEQRDLARCLDSVRGLVDELIVVDTGSTDGTRDIAAEYGGRVIPFDFSRVDFAAARNCGLNAAKGKWLFVLDADETLAPESRSEVDALIARDASAGYYCERRNHGPAGFKTDYVARLFPNRPEFRYRGRVHETIGGLLHRSGVRIEHRFAMDAEARRRRNYWYIEILKEEIAADPADDSRLDFLAAEYHQLGMFGEASKVAERITRVRPEDARAHLFAGFYRLFYQSDPAGAESYFRRALELRPDYPEAAEYLGLAARREVQRG